jgi:DMSO/TMAO reductase YedYZ molybdopterin-dependent catalytic subunit
MRNQSRREAISTFAAAGAAVLFDPRSLLDRVIDQRCADSAWGLLLRTLPLSRRDGVDQPFGVKQGGAGLDARLVTDLSTLQPDRLITPNALACVRTEAPAVAKALDGWSVTISGQVGDARGLTVKDLARRARPMGAHLLECSGNNNPANFGLMSVSEYHGVPLADIVARAIPSGVAWGVLVSGLDPALASASSVPGASWIFPLASLRQLDAFLAVRMNGEPLPLDHGAPIRLVVPGWYACTWIKWVNEIRLTLQNEPATSQMKEFSERTHQARAHDRARDYAPAAIQAAAMPVRVEKRRGPSGLEYRVVGIVWGGSQPVDRLAIRFGANDRWTEFAVCPASKTHRAWSLWEYRWKPAQPGIYEIALKVPDPSVPQRRLDSGFYIRQVRVEEV